MNPIRLTTSLEIKALSNMQFEGHGSVFGNVDLGGDVVLPGAFKRTLAQHKSEGTLPAMFWMHDPSRVAGKWLDMSEDDRGLVTRGELAPTDLGKEIHTLLKMEAVKGLSIGYIPTLTDYTNDGVRLIKEVDLLEVSVVSIPMNPKAQIAHVKSRLSARGEYIPTDLEMAELKRDTEKFLRARGFNRKLATQCALNIFSNLFDFDQSAMRIEADSVNGRLISDQKTDSSAMPSQATTNPSATPEEIEVEAGLTEFRERQLAYELDKRFKRIFG